MKKSNSFLLVYGSETGQAQAIAEQIAEKSADFGLQANLHCLEETGKGFNIEKEACMVMVTSTTGDGDAPDNASKFLRRIKKKTLSPDYLSHLNYTILGLGDTNYNNFCKCPRDMDSRLEQLGAKRFYPTGLADDGVGLELVADPWLEGLYPALKEFLGLSSNHSPENLLSERVASLALKSKDISETEGQSVETTADRFPTENDSVDSVAKDKTNPLLTENDSVDSSGKNKTNNSSAMTGLNGLNGSGISNSSNGIPESFKDDFDGSEVSYSKYDCDERETSCVKVDITSDNSDIKWRLGDCCTSLADKDLTIPVLGPEFLHVEYSNKSCETGKLPFQNGCKLPSSASDIMYAQISSAKVLTKSDAVKKTLWLKLCIKNEDVKYSPGDSISVICSNNGSEVQLLLERLKATALADQQISLTLIPNTKKRRAAVPPHVHPVTTLRHLLKTCVSIRDPPSKAFIRALIEHTSEDVEVRRLQELCSKEGAEEYTKSIREKSVSLLDFLYAFPSCQPPMERVLEFLPRLLPRPYSICSCPEIDPHNLDIVFNVVDISGDVNSGHYYQRRGVCTGWLDDITTSIQDSEHNVDISEDITIPIFFRSNQHFHPPSDLSRPLILIGPGTGVAPFIGFLQQRALVKSRQEKGEGYGETWLFSGCRNKDKDFIFSKEIEEFLASGTLNKLCASFSRDSESALRYVQHYMKSESTSLASLVVDSDALVYVCGDAKNMAKDVNAAFQEILISERGFSADEAQAFIMKKRLHKSYLEDVWT